MSEQSILERAGAKVTPTSLMITNPDLPYEQFEELCHFLGDLNKSCAWWIGDALLAGEGLYGEKIAQAAELLDLSPQTLANRMSICSRIPRSRRRSDVHFSLHAEVAYLEPKEQKEWLDKISRNNWTRSVLRDHLIPDRKRRMELESAPESAGADSPTAEVRPISTHVCKCPACGRIHYDNVDVEFP